MDGLHVRMGDRAAWAQAMQLMLDGRRVRRYSQSCLRAAEMFVDLDCYRRRLVAIYRDAAAAQLQERRRLN
jgi:hypothetical protein